MTNFPLDSEAVEAAAKVLWDLDRQYDSHLPACLWEDAQAIKDGLYPAETARTRARIALILQAFLASMGATEEQQTRLVTKWKPYDAA